MKDKTPDFSDVQSGSSSTASPDRFYVVKPGDNLSKIAKQELGRAGDWKRIFDANRDVIQDPDKIYPGQKLKIPA
jgi:nucleoid-associated protein YgaU